MYVPHLKFFFSILTPSNTPYETLIQLRINLMGYLNLFVNLIRIDTTNAITKAEIKTIVIGPY